MELEDKMNCSCGLLLIVFNIVAGGWSVDYLLAFFQLKNIPFVADMAIGLIAAELSFPAAVVIAILKYFGVL